MSIISICENVWISAYHKLLRHLRQHKLIIAVEMHCLYTICTLCWCAHEREPYLVILSLNWYIMSTIFDSVEHLLYLTAQNIYYI